MQPPHEVCEMAQTPRRRVRAFAFLVASAVVANFAYAQQTATPPLSVVPKYPGSTIDGVVPPGHNFDKAEFRLWYPDGVARLRGIVLLMPGSNGDGRPMALDTVWQAFAVKHKFALVAGRLTDKAHEQSFIEDYIKVGDGSGQAVLTVISEFADKSKHPELATAPMLLWGMSAGGQFNYEFVAWKPERVIAFVVNKGGIYYSALVPRAARETPGVLFVGGKDLEFRTNTIVGLFAVNRRAGALWALSEEPGAGHVVGKSRDLALLFYEDVMTERLPPSPGPLKPMPVKPSYLGDFKAKSYKPLGDGTAPGYPTAWLPTERVAQTWQAILTEQTPGSARP